MSVMKYANAMIEEPILDQHYWEHLHGKRGTPSRIKTAAAGLDLRQFLLTHATIMASVMCEDYPDWLIKPECSHLVNNNEDAWENTVLEMSYPTFCGAFNFQEHYQNSKAKKGYIVDAVLRKIGLGDKDAWVYYCDILVATDLRNEKLVEDIRSKKVRYLSMGCVTDLITCSYCGAHNGGEGPTCAHTANSKGRFLPDRDGVSRRVAELCGHKSLPGGGVTFVEASWVARPAFPGAAGRSFIEEAALPDVKVASDLLALPGTRKVASELLTPVVDEWGHVAPAEMRRLR